MLSQTSIFQWLVRAIVLFTAMPVHECAHGYVAYKLGDDTARLQGRLTLNPFVHLDLFGSLLLVLTGFGWAKPVQVNPRNFKNPRRDMAISSLAGPMSNILLALLVMIIAKVLVRLIPGTMIFTNMGNTIYIMLSYMILVNLYLAVFNLIPFPPLDGFKIFGSFFPDRTYFKILEYERYIALILFALIFMGVLSYPINIVATYIYRFLNFITGPLGSL